MVEFLNIFVQCYLHQLFPCKRSNTLVKLASTPCFSFTGATQVLDHCLMKEMFCSDEKYLQFQVDGNLQYKCAACRGECYQVALNCSVPSPLFSLSQEGER